ncbi:MAG: hypothetical protein L7U57_01825 [Glaciecola sp.]|nr:hypothetical protein [Glaciecola sp.]
MKKTDKKMDNHIRRVLTTLDVSLKPNVKIVVYDTEEMCEQEHQNNWAKRLATL